MKRDGKIAEIEGERVNWSHEGGCLKRERKREKERERWRKGRRRRNRGRRNDMIKQRKRV